MPFFGGIHSYYFFFPHIEHGMVDIYIYHYRINESKIDDSIFFLRGSKMVSHSASLYSNCRAPQWRIIASLLNVFFLCAFHFDKY